MKTVDKSMRLSRLILLKGIIIIGFRFKSLWKVSVKENIDMMSDWDSRRACSLDILSEQGRGPLSLFRNLVINEK